jgi:glycosyltransferase involved in cell wall biosynthesis
LKSVAFVVGTLSGGGAERFVSHALEALDRTQYRPSLVLFRHAIDYPLSSDIPLFILEKHSALDSFKAIWRLRNWLLNTQPDIVLSAWSAPNFFVAAAMSFLPADRCPSWIARIANDPLQEETGLYHILMKYLYRRADVIVANSQGVAEGFTEHYPRIAAKKFVVPNPVDLPALKALGAEQGHVSRDERPTILAVGRLFRQKRYDILLRAFHELRKSINARLIICGDGPLKAELSRLIQELGVDDAVSLEGFVHNPYAWMAIADLLVLTSDHEGLPNVLIEAQALGVPVVATDCRFGPSEIIEPGRTGLLVRTGDVSGIADAMLTLLRAPERRRSMGDAARRLMTEKFDLEIVMGSLMEIFQETSKARGYRAK